MKKNFLIFCFICLFLFFINPKMVKAYVLPDGSYTLECIYDDGGLYTLEFYDGSIITNRTPYNLHGVANSEANGGGAYEFKNQLGIRNVSDGAYRCQTEMYMAKFDDTNFYKFGEKFKACTDDKCEEFNARTNGWYAFWGTETDENYEKAKSAINKANNNPYLLVSESITFNGDAPDPKVTLYYIKDNGTAKQAASSNSYIKIFSYDNNHTFLEKDGRTTYLDGSTYAFPGAIVSKVNGRYVVKPNEGYKDEKIDDIYINVAEPIPSKNSSSSLSYSFDAIRYKVATANKLGQEDYPRSQLTEHYVLTDPIDDSSSTIDNSLCEKRLGKTSKYLRLIIQALQIGVPAITIILTGIDIGKIVVSGNLEEELPKKKKTIIYRLIIMLVFFFLPIFVRLFITLLKTSGAKNSDAILYIDCLFETDASIEEEPPVADPKPCYGDHCMEAK